MIFEREYDLDGEIIDVSLITEDSNTELKQLDDVGDILEHFGVKGMRWGVRRAIGADGLVKGSVEDAIKGVKKTAPKGKSSADQKTLEKNIKKDVSSLSTQEIRDLTGRIKAIKEFKAVTAEQKAAQRTVLRKILNWGAKQVVAGAKKKGESYLQNTTGELLDRVLPGFKPKTKDKTEDTSNSSTSSSSTSDASSSSSTSDAPSSSSTSAPKPEDSPTSPEREKALRSLAETLMNEDGSYTITDLDDGKG